MSSYTVVRSLYVVHLNDIIEVRVTLNLEALTNFGRSRVRLVLPLLIIDKLVQVGKVSAYGETATKHRM